MKAKQARTLACFYILFGFSAAGAVTARAFTRAAARATGLAIGAADALLA